MIDIPGKVGLKDALGGLTTGCEGDLVTPLIASVDSAGLSWQGGFPPPPSPLHMHPSQNCMLSWRGWPSQIKKDYSSVKSVEVTALPC